MMNIRIPTLTLALTIGSAAVVAQDWPQWLGPNRDGRAANFVTPRKWPGEMKLAWKQTVGEGVATPALVGDRLYVFSRQEGYEVIRALNAADGRELWADKYESLGASGPAQGFSGPRSSPVISGGKVATLGVRGMLSSLDANSGKLLWRKDDFKAYPNFFPSSSPMILDGNVIAQLGGRENGAIVAYDVATGEQKWKWNGPSPSYASPAVLTVGGSKFIVAHTENRLVVVHAGDGSLAWELEGAAPQGGGPGGPGGGEGGGRGRGGGGRDYRAATPVVNGQMLLVAGRGIRAFKFEKQGNKLAGTELWNNAEQSVQFATPLLKDGLLYGLSPGNDLFAVRASDGKLAWTAPLPSGAPAESIPRALHYPNVSSQTLFAQAEPPAGGGGEGRPPRGPGGPSGPGGPGGGRRGGGMGGGGQGYGTIVDAGSAVAVLTPRSHLVFVQPGEKEFKVLASYKVSESQTHAFPVISGKRIFIKDKDSVALWTVE